MANGTLKALNELSEQVPGLHQKALRQVQAARDISLQQQLGTAPVQKGPGLAGTIATQRALQAGQDIIGQRQQAAQRAQQIRQATLSQKQQRSQLALQQKQMQQQERLQQERLAQLSQVRQQELESKRTVTDAEQEAADRLAQLGIEQDNKLQLATLNQREDLARIGLDVKAKLLDSRLRFETDEMGRKFTNERQMADYIAASARDKQDFNTKMSQMKQGYDRKILLLKQSQAQIAAALERGFLKEQDDLDFEAKKDLARLSAEMKDKIRREQAKARNRQAMFQAGGTILGAAVGTAIGPGAGTAAGATAGAAIGGGLGSLAGSLG